MLKILISLPLIGIMIPQINFKYKNKRKSISIGLLISIFILFFILFFYFLLNNNLTDFQFRESINILGINIILGIDGITISLLIIIGIIMPIILFLKEKSYSISDTSFKRENIEITRIVLILEMILISVFLVLDILYFFILFEIILIPMFLLVGKFGSKTNRIEAAYRFLIYTMIGSLMMLISIIIIYYKLGTTSIEIINYKIVNQFINNFQSNNELIKFFALI